MRVWMRVKADRRIRAEQRLCPPASEELNEEMAHVFYTCPPATALSACWPFIPVSTFFYPLWRRIPAGLEGLSDIGSFVCLIKLNFAERSS